MPAASGLLAPYADISDPTAGPHVAPQHLVLGAAYDVADGVAGSAAWTTVFQLPLSSSPLAAAFASSAAEASPDVAQALGDSSPGAGQLPASGGGSAAGSAAAGIASSALFALLVSFTAFALWHLARLLLTPARWRPQAFVAVLERPG
jgi:hypothetical protein